MCLACTHNSVVLVFSRVEATLRVKELYATYIHETYMPTDRHTYMHTWIKTYMHAYKHEAWSMTLSYFMHSSLHAYMHMFIIMSNSVSPWFLTGSVFAQEWRNPGGWPSPGDWRTKSERLDDWWPSADDAQLLLCWESAPSHWVRRCRFLYGLFLRAMHFRPLIGHRTDIGFKIDRLSDWV